MSNVWFSFSDDSFLCSNPSTADLWVVFYFVQPHLFCEAILSWVLAATTTLVATETSTPGNHSICFARRITTDPLKIQVTRQRDWRSDRAKGESDGKQMGKPWLVAKVTLRQHSSIRLYAIGWQNGRPGCYWLEGRRRVGLGLDMWDW